MATAKSGTLVVNTPVNVTIDVAAYGAASGFSVTNRSDTGTIWVRKDGTPAAVAADENFPVIGERVFQNADGSTTVTVSLISSTACDYTVGAA